RDSRRRRRHARHERHVGHAPRARPSRPEARRRARARAACGRAADRPDRARARDARGRRVMHEPWWITIIKSFVIINLVMVAFAYTTWLERKLLGRMQLRYGPNRAGPFGLLQPIADLLKLVRKEAFEPTKTESSLLYIAAPVISMFTALAAFSVI